MELGENIERNARRTEVRDSASASPWPQHHLYYDVRTGTWGERGDLVIVSLFDDHYAEWQELSDEERFHRYGYQARYFGGRVTDAPKSETPSK